MPNFKLSWIYLFCPGQILQHIAICPGQINFVLDKLLCMCKFVLDKLAKNLNIPKNRIFINYNEIGNSVSATIPIALYEAKKRKILKNNSLVILSGFGVGYSWGSCLVRWNDV